jgi:hypothetical protein
VESKTKDNSSWATFEFLSFMLLEVYPLPERKGRPPSIGCLIASRWGNHDAPHGHANSADARITDREALIGLLQFIERGNPLWSRFIVC